MTAKAPIRQADVARVIRGALSAGLPAGSFVVEVGEKVIRLLPANLERAPSADPLDAELAQWAERNGYG